VGPDGVEPSTSPLSGVRSSQLSYGPRGRPSPFWWSWSGSNRRPPECKSGALPAELQPLTSKSIEASWMQGLGNPVPCRFRNSSHYSKWRCGTGSPESLGFNPEKSLAVWSGTAVLYRLTLYTQALVLSKTPPTVSLRKEVIQPQVLLRLPCYDFTPIMNHTLGRCLPLRGQRADF
jgi:hypothetical protein